MTSIIDPNVALAIMDVEANREGFGPSGAVLIRFEAHIFRQRLNNEQLFQEHFSVATERPWAEKQWYRRSPADPWNDIHTGKQASEWGAFDVATRLDYRAAIESISMGMAQIMGFNHARIGYDSPEDMLEDFDDGDGVPQVVGLFNYILSDSTLFQAVRNRDWREIARLYNGAGNVDVYAPLLEAAYERRVSA